MKQNAQIAPPNACRKKNDEQAVRPARLLERCQDTRLPVSQNDTAPAALLLVDRQEGGPRGSFKDVVNAIARQRRTFEVFPRAYHVLHVVPLLRRRKLQTLLTHFLLGEGVVTEILLQANEDDGHAWTSFPGLLGPLVLDVLEGVGRVDGEADQNHVSLGIC